MVVELGNRTPDLLIANEALSQLSYSPIPRNHCHARRRCRGRNMRRAVPQVKRPSRYGGWEKAGPGTRPLAPAQGRAVAHRRSES